MKWYTSSAAAVAGSRWVSSAKGLLRAKLLCVSRIRVELERVSPSRSEGKPVVKSLKERSSGPMSMLVAVAPGGWESSDRSLLRMTERMAWVPHAFWMVWLAKKRPSSSTAVGRKVPSCGAEGVAELDPIYLNRKMTP